MMRGLQRVKQTFGDGAGLGRVEQAFRPAIERPSMGASVPEVLVAAQMPSSTTAAEAAVLNKALKRCSTQALVSGPSPQEG